MQELDGYGNVPIMRTSERRDFLRCQQRWWWAWREGLRERGAASEADALWFGTGVHLALASWYCGPGAKRGPHPAETWQAYARDAMRTIKLELALESPGSFGEETEAIWVSAEELGLAMMNGYVELYGRDEHKLIISPEQTFDLPVPWPTDQSVFEVKPNPDGSMPWLIRYVGTFDDVWRHADTGWLMLDEHKTAKSISLDHLPLDPQAGSYWAVATRTLRSKGLIGPREHLKGIEYNFMRKGKPDTRPRDREGYYCNKPTKQRYIEDLTGLENPDERGCRLNAADLKKLKLPELEALARRCEFTVLGERSKVQPAPLFVRHEVLRTRQESVTQLHRMQQEALSMAVLRAGILPPLKNPSRECNMGGFRCPYYEMCELHEQGADISRFKRAAFQQRDPYADHRKDA